MTQYKITAPVADFRGEVVGVVFSQGHALLDVDHDAPRVDGATNLPQPLRALTYFQQKGYTVEEVTQPEAAKPAEEPAGDDGEPKLPAKTASKTDWVKYATEHGAMTAVDANAMTRDELAAKYHEEASK